MASRPPGLPPAKALSKGKLAALSNVLQDEAAIAKVKQDGKASIFFDKDSPAARKRRENMRAEFEYIIASIHPEDESIWSVDTITEYTKQYIQIATSLSKGRLEEKPRVDSLFHRKEAIYWWAVRLIPEFSKIFVTWHNLVNAHIGYVALKTELSKKHYEKHNLTDLEMEILFNYVMSKTTSVANFKQHYLAWLIVWVTSIRPGSFTVCPGYRKGDSLGIEGMVRESDETLRFSHCTFMKVDDGITVQVEFEFNKGQRNPYTRKIIMGQRKFTFVPCTGNRYFLDVSSILVAIALERGLFSPINTFEQLLEVDVLYVPKDPEVDAQAVFLASDIGKNTLLPDKAMREAALNPVLQIATSDVGLWSRNTIYSLRRTAILETRRSEGTEVARDIAGHTMGSKAILAYDNVGVSDIDIVALRTGDDGLNREDIRALWAQATVARVDVTAALQAEMEEYVNRKMRIDAQFIAAENTLQECLDAIWASCETDEKTIANARKVVGDGLEDSQEASMLSINLEAALATRKEVRRSLRRKLTAEFKKDALAKHTTSIKALSTKAGATHSHGALPASLAAEHNIASSSSKENIESQGASVEQSLKGLGVNEEDQEAADENEEVDSEAIADFGGGDSSDQPVQWASIEAEEVEVPGDDANTAATETRADFIRRFLTHRDLASTDLKCILCQLDDTCTTEQKDLVYYRKEDLDRHMRSTFHTPTAQLKRARAS